MDLRPVTFVMTRAERHLAPLRPGLYGMVDLTLSPPGRRHLELGRELLQGGCRILQLRAKGRSPNSLLRLGRALARCAAEVGGVLVINDHLSVALRIPGVGVHLGQDDGDFRRARRRLGSERLLGISTHSLAQAIEAERLGADYIGFGPIYSAATKGTAEPAVGLAALSRVTKRVSIPVVAIGGVERTRLVELRRAGASAVACIRDVSSQPDPRQAARLYVRAFS